MCDIKTCEDCYFYGLCDEGYEAYSCKDFAPLDGENIDEYIEKERDSFREEWNKYLEQFYE
jgi:hypothetical protein